MAGESVNLETGLEALQSRSEFNGPVEEFDGHQCNDHFAHLYATQDEKFTAAIPFIRHGLNHNERVMYVIDEATEAEVRTALRDAGVDVVAALDSGALTFHTVQETYLRNGSFDVDEMIDFYADAVEEVTDDYEALRIVAETTWLQNDATTVEQFMEYEAKVNDLFADEDCLALCQYDRNEFSPDIVRNIVQTHPHLIYDGAVCHNFYYTPPEEFFGADDPARENERMLQMLRERTEAKTELQQRERFQQKLSEITADSARSFDANIRRLLELGTERFDLEIGYFTRTYSDDTFEIVDAVGPNEQIKPGVTDSICDTYCEKLLASPGLIAVRDAADVGWTGDPAYEQFGLDAYLARTVYVGGEEYGTLCFASETPREAPYTDAERAFLDQMGQWMGDELERRRRERFFQESYEITSNPTLDFEEKLQSLFELGCEQFSLELGAMAKVDPDADLFEVEYVSTDHEHFEPGLELPLSETYCTAATDTGGIGSVDDPVKAGYDDIYVHNEFGIKTYLGTYIEVEGDLNRTFFFVSEQPRHRPFSDDERTFQRLLGQWVKYELERQQREAFLRNCYEITSDASESFDAKLDALCDLGCKQFGFDLGGLAKVDPDTDLFEVEMVNDEHDHLTPGAQADLSETYCRVAVEENVATTDAEPVAVTDPVSDGFEGELCYEQFGVRAYFGTYLDINGDTNRTFWFVSNEPRDEPITDTEQTFLDLMSQWIKYELERQQHERFLRKSYEITSDPSLSFEAKLERLFRLGCERFGVEMAGLNHLPSWDGPFRLEKSVGLGVDTDEDLWTNPGAGCFCRQTIEQESPVSMADVSNTDWAEDPIHQEFGLTSYLGTKVRSGSTLYGTLWFGSTEPRDREFSETERAFIELIGQWVSYELEQREYKQSHRELYEITADNELSTDEKFEQLLELGCEYLDLPVGMVTREREEAFEIKQMHGSHPDLDEGTLTPPMTDNYCRRVVDTGEPISIADAGAAGWNGDTLYHEFDLKCYAGVQLTVGDDAYGTICFTDLSPRDVEFTEPEQTFLELMGQCMSYELERTYREEDLQQKNSRLENFASMLAHELRNPTMIGQIYSQQLPDETESEAVEHVTEAFDRIEDMIDVMLVLTRGRDAVGERTPVELSEAAGQAWAKVDAPDANLTIETDDVIEADETYLEHLFRNLLENAVEHGGADVTVTVGELSDGFYVADDGPGIPPEDREMVFDEGYTTTAESGGSGIGLAFVKKLAEVYGWDYTAIESDAGGARLELQNVDIESNPEE